MSGRQAAPCSIGILVCNDRLARACEANAAESRVATCSVVRPLTRAFRERSLVRSRSSSRRLGEPTREFLVGERMPVRRKVIELPRFLVPVEDQ